MAKFIESKKKMNVEQDNVFKRIFGVLKGRNGGDEVAEVGEASKKYQPNEEMIRKLEIIQRKMYHDQMRMRRKTIERYNRARNATEIMGDDKFS